MLQKPVRLLVVLFLTAVALILFGLSVTVAMYDEDRAIAESMVLYDRAALVMKPDESPFSEEDLAVLEERTGKAFGTLSPAPQELLPGLMQFTAGENKSLGDLTHCITKSPDGMIVLSEAVLGEAEGYTLTGRLPEGTAEIAPPPPALRNCSSSSTITTRSQARRCIMRDSFTWEYDKTHLTRISSHEELIGEKLYLADPAGGEPLKASIVGILEYECGREGYHNASDMSLTLEDQLIVSEEYAKAAFGGSAGMFAIAGPPEKRFRGPRHSMSF